jgi:hypothetical protein
MNEWIRVEDFLPPINKKVLVCTEGEAIQIAFRDQQLEYDEHWIICEDSCCSCSGITAPVVAWMALPQLIDPCIRVADSVPDTTPVIDSVPGPEIFRSKKASEPPSPSR